MLGRSLPNKILSPSPRSRASSSRGNGIVSLDKRRENHRGVLAEPARIGRQCP
jgi:hypothetical protein